MGAGGGTRCSRSRHDADRLHPGGGQYDILAVTNSDDQTRVLINRSGSIWVEHGGLKKAVVDKRVWPTLASGALSVATLAVEVGAGLPAGCPAREVPAALARARPSHAPLGALPAWMDMPLGYHDSSGPEGSAPHSELFQPYREHGDLYVRWRGDTVTGEQVRDYWFVLDADGGPVACVDVDGYVQFPSGDGVELAVSFPREPAWATASSLFGPAIQRAASATPALTPGLGIAATLGAFNRKGTVLPDGGSNGGAFLRRVGRSLHADAGRIPETHPGRDRLGHPAPCVGSHGLSPRGPARSLAVAEPRSLARPGAPSHLGSEAADGSAWVNGTQRGR